MRAGIHADFYPGLTYVNLCDILEVTELSKGFYNLSEVHSKINNGLFLINSNASRDAYDDFGWQTAEILEAYMKLEPKHYYKTDVSKINPYIVIDYYKGRINGENVYTHFYIDDKFNKLIINSFKKI